MKKSKMPTQGSLYSKSQMALFSDPPQPLEQLDLMPTHSQEAIAHIPVDQQLLLGKAVQAYYLPTERSKKPRKAAMFPMLTIQNYSYLEQLIAQEQYHAAWFEEI